jgi:hypothetical protein
MGFEMLTIITSQNFNILGYFDSENISMPLNFSSNASSSRLFGHAPAGTPILFYCVLMHNLKKKKTMLIVFCFYVEIIKIFSTENVTLNNHHQGISPNIWNCMDFFLVAPLFLLFR